MAIRLLLVGLSHKKVAGQIRANCEDVTQTIFLDFAYNKNMFCSMSGGGRVGQVLDQVLMGVCQSSTPKPTYF